MVLLEEIGPHGTPGQALVALTVLFLAVRPEVQQFEGVVADLANRRVLGPVGGLVQPLAAVLEL